MKINMQQPLIGFNGQPIKDGDLTITLGVTACRALMTSADNDKITGEEKLKRHALAKKIWATLDEEIAQPFREVDLTIEEVALVKRLIGTLFVPLIVGPAWEAIESSG